MCPFALAHLAGTLRNVSCSQFTSAVTFILAFQFPRVCPFAVSFLICGDGPKSCKARGLESDLGVGKSVGPRRNDIGSTLAPSNGPHWTMALIRPVPPAKGREWAQKLQDAGAGQRFWGGQLGGTQEK